MWYWVNSLQLNNLISIPCLRKRIVYYSEKSLGKCVSFTFLDVSDVVSYKNTKSTETLFYVS